MKAEEKEAVEKDLIFRKRKFYEVNDSRKL